MIRTLTLAVLLITLTGCADVRFYAAGYADLLIHRDNPMVLTTRITKCGQTVGWVRLSDADKMVAACDADCNCKLVRGRVAPKRDAGICQ